MSAPLVRPEIDLRDFPYMPLDVVRLRDSDLSALSSGEGFRAAVMLWCACWHQIPAASLPDDDRILANLAGFGRAVGEWTKIKEEALRGFVLCDDGRFYHPLIAEKANDAWEAKMRQRARTEAARRAKLGQKAASACDNAQDVSVTEVVTCADADLLQAPRERDRDREKDSSRTSSLRSDGASAPEVRKPEKQKRAKARTQIAEDAQPSEADRALSAEIGMVPATFRHEWQKFRDHHLKLASQMADWPAAWRTWAYGWQDRGGKQFTGQAPPAMPADLVAAEGFYAAAGSPELEAWQDHLRATTGKSAPVDMRGGWYFPTQFPPKADERAA